MKRKRKRSVARGSKFAKRSEQPQRQHHQQQQQQQRPTQEPKSQGAQQHQQQVQCGTRRSQQRPQQQQHQYQHHHKQHLAEQQQQRQRRKSTSSSSSSSSSLLSVAVVASSGSSRARGQMFSSLAASSLLAKAPTTSRAAATSTNNTTTARASSDSLLRHRKTRDSPLLLLDSRKPRQQREQQQIQRSPLAQSLSPPTNLKPMVPNKINSATSEVASAPREDTTRNAMEFIKSTSNLHSWHWNENDKSHECVVSEDKLEVCFHPICSDSAAAIRGSDPLIRDGNHYYWEVTVADKTYGTSVMFGLCTKEQSLHANEYCNLVGLDKEGWSLSHKGHTWHNGIFQHYTEMFPPNQSVTIGLLFDTMRGELSYFMNGKNLGVAFSGLNNVKNELYPVIGSTAKCTRMRLSYSCRGNISLLKRSCFTSLIYHSQGNFPKLLEYLQNHQVPREIINFITNLLEIGLV